MEFRTVREMSGYGSVYTLYPISDIHFGTKACHKKKIYEVRKEIMNDAFARWIGIGDYMEWIDYKDRRFDPKVVDTSIYSMEDMNLVGDVSVKYLTDFFKPIIEKCWGIADGNHEETFSSKTGTALVPRVLEKLGADPELYVQWCCSTEVIFTDAHKHNSTCRIWYEHGWQAGRTQGATRNDMHKLPSSFDGYDIYLRGHSHHLFADPVTIVEDDDEDYKDRRAYVAHTGSYLKSYAKGIVGYSERFGYPPTALGGLKFRLFPMRNRVNIEAII